MNDSTSRRYDHLALLAFAFTAVASIALENLMWVAILLLFFHHWKTREKIHWPSNLFTIATLIFLATFFIGSIVGINPVKSFESVHKSLTILILFPIGAMALSLVEIEKLIHYFVYGAAVCAIFGIGKHFILHQERIDSFSGDKMVFGGMLMVSLILVLTLLKDRPKDSLIYICGLLIGVALVLTETRGAWLGFAAGGVLLAWRFNRKWLMIGTAFVLIGFFFLPAELQNRVKSIGDFWFYYNKDHQLENASQSRYMIWFSGTHIIADHPFGIGQGNLPDIYPQYRMPNSDLEPTVPHLHDNFLQICAQNGWQGLAAYLFWIFSFYWVALRSGLLAEKARNLNWGLLCVFSAILVWGLTEYTFSHQFMYVQFFLLGLQMELLRGHSSNESSSQRADL